MPESFDLAGDAGFPCWVVADARGVAVLDWESVRLVEGTAVAFDDGSERLYASVEFCPSVVRFASSIIRALDTVEAGTLPAC
jgi:hypothetical protein